MISQSEWQAFLDNYLAYIVFGLPGIGLFIAGMRIIRRQKVITIHHKITRSTQYEMPHVWKGKDAVEVGKGYLLFSLLILTPLICGLVIWLVELFQ